MTSGSSSNSPLESTGIWCGDRRESTMCSRQRVQTLPSGSIPIKQTDQIQLLSQPGDQFVGVTFKDIVIQVRVVTSFGFIMSLTYKKPWTMTLGS